VHVTARTLQRDVTLLADKVDPDAVVDDAMITLLAGESATFHVRSEVEVDPDELLRRSVLRSTNHLVDVWPTVTVGTDPSNGQAIPAPAHDTDDPRRR